MTLSTRLSLLTFAVGFVIEGSTEAYQLATIGFLGVGWIGFYYVGLATTVLGFVLMYRGRREWTELHRRRVERGHRSLWVALALFAAGTAAIAIVGTVHGSPSSGPLPPGVAWLVGGLVTLAFATFFLGLWLLVSRMVGPVGLALATAALAWSFGVAVLTGLVVGSEIVTLVTQFFTDPLELIVSFAPLAFVMAPLCVAYFLYAAAYLEAYRNLAVGAAPGDRPSPQPAPPG